MHTHILIYRPYTMHTFLIIITNNHWEIFSVSARNEFARRTLMQSPLKGGINNRWSSATWSNSLPLTLILTTKLNEKERLYRILPTPSSHPPTIHLHIGSHIRIIRPYIKLRIEIGHRHTQFKGVRNECR